MSKVCQSVPVVGTRTRPGLCTSPPCSPGQKMNPAARKQAGLGYSGRGLCGLGASWDRPPRLGIAALALPERPPDRKTAQTHRFRMPGGVKYACRRAASVAIRMGTCPAFIECTYVTYVRRCACISCMHVHGISTIAEKAIELSVSVHTWSPKSGVPRAARSPFRSDFEPELASRRRKEKSCFLERSSFLLLKETSFQSIAFYQLPTKVGWYPPKKVPRRLKPVA